MANYPQISEGLGKLTPALWARLMKGLKDFEDFTANNNAMRVRDRKGRRGKRGGVSASNLVRVKNTGSNQILQYEACVVQTNYITLDDQLDACESCSGSTVCDFGECGVWPGGGDEGKGYSDVYDMLRSSPDLTVEVKDARSTSTLKPKPGALLDVLVAAGDIGAGEEGFCYLSGLHYAWIWDPRGITNCPISPTTNGSLRQHEFLYADLPDIPMGYKDGYGPDQWTDSASIYTGVPEDPFLTGGGLVPYDYTFDGDGSAGSYITGNGVSGYDVYLPLIARPQGRYRIHWIDTTDKVYQNTSDGSAGTQKDWWLADWACNITGAGEHGEPEGHATGYDSRIRMALVERLPHWETPTVMAQVTRHTQALKSGQYQDLQYWYQWRYLVSGTWNDESANYFNYWQLAEYGYGINMPELHNCLCTNSTCSNCGIDPDDPPASDDFNDFAGGINISKLNDCFGIGGWELVPAAGYNDQSNGIGKMSFVNMRLGMDENGNQMPSFSIQNGVQSICVVSPG